MAVIDQTGSEAVRQVPEGGARRKIWLQTFEEDLQETKVSWSGDRRVASDLSR